MRLPIDIGPPDRSLGDVRDGRTRGSAIGVCCCEAGPTFDDGEITLSGGLLVDATATVGVAGGAGRTSSLTAGARLCPPSSRPVIA